VYDIMCLTLRAHRTSHIERSTSHNPQRTANRNLRYAQAMNSTHTHTHHRPALLRLALVGAAAGVLWLVFAMYTQPEFVVNMANQLWSCF
jgi:hypothetical protein